MKWVFSHCSNDGQVVDGHSGCAGCPALPKKDGTPAAEQCAAVFVESPMEIPGWFAPPKTQQDIVDDVYRGGAVSGLTRANCRRLLADTPSAKVEPSFDTQRECRRLFGPGWD